MKENADINKVPSEKTIHRKNEIGYYAQHQNQDLSYKEAVAKKVVDLIQDSDSLILDAGTSATCVWDAILHSKKENLSILTHNMEVFHRYRVYLEERVAVLQGTSVTDQPSYHHQHQLLLTGGCFDMSYNGLYGNLTERAYEEFHPNVVVLAISGLTASSLPTIGKGVYCHAVVETDVKERLFRVPVKRRIIIADATKIGRVDSHKFGDLEQISSTLQPLGEAYLVTTKPKSNDKNENRAFEETIEIVKSLGIKVIFAEN